MYKIGSRYMKNNINKTIIKYFFIINGLRIRKQI